MARKGFLSWVGFSGESAPQVNSGGEVSTSAAIERIRELENQIADLRARKDITSLTREEFEILATETAMNLVKTAQNREKSASNQAAKILSESSRIAQEATANAESKAKTILATAESRGRKYLEAAQSESEEIKNQATQMAKSLSDAAQKEVAALKIKTHDEIESLIASKKREAAALTSSAKQEAENLVAEAISNVADYRNWLISAVAESERLYKIQTQSLAAAQQAIEQSKQRLSHAFEKLTSLTDEVAKNLSDEDVPVVKEFTRSQAAEKTKEIATRTAPKKREPSQKTAGKTTAKKQLRGALLPKVLPQRGAQSNLQKRALESKCRQANLLHQSKDQIFNDISNLLMACAR